ncbi:MAG: caspase family protein [Methylovulum sp.]|uniref:caspase family protein n=1 Tax=Methylovulum sp. TaxID=1916980 RepID=UPI002637A186|nr:caspase family protein [Methylovulum sp.]MDD2723882.1 caspase family protein [Methylovulum sp.]
MPAVPKAFLIKKITTQLIWIFLSSNLLLTGCATVGANLALDLAKEEEAKGCAASYPGDIAKVAEEDCERISRLIKKAGVPGGFVGYDKSGRIKLKGSYLNEDQVDLAYMTALTVVGTSSMDISPVTPRDLQEIKLVKSYVPQQNLSGKGEKYALLVGVSKFQNGIGGIQTAVKDIESIKDALKKSSGFKEENITLIKDERATKNNILNALRELKNKASPNDSVVFYISTHGTPPNTFGKMGIIPYDLKSDLKTEDVQALADKINKNESGDDAIIKIVKQRIATLKTAVSFDDIQDFITGINTDKFVAVLDTCYSGAALGALTYPVGGAQYVEREQNYSQSLNAENKSDLIGSGKMCSASSYNNTALSGIKTQQQLIADQEKCNSKGSKSLFLTDTNKFKVTQSGENYNYEMMENFRTAFGNTNIRQQQGKIILTATSGDEKSQFDSDKVPTSYFTYYLAKGLQNSHGQIFPAFDYARIRTRKVVSDSLENCSQTPEMISTPNECINFDLSR